MVNDGKRECAGALVLQFVVMCKGARSSASGQTGVSTRGVEGVGAFAGVRGASDAGGVVMAAVGTEGVGCINVTVSIVGIALAIAVGVSVGGSVATVWSCPIWSSSVLVPQKIGPIQDQTRV